MSKHNEMTGMTESESILCKREGKGKNEMSEGRTCFIMDYGGVRKREPEWV
jgi:hypothetical protein